MNWNIAQRPFLCCSIAPKSDFRSTSFAKTHTDLIVKCAGRILVVKCFVHLKGNCFLLTGEEINNRGCTQKCTRYKMYFTFYADNKDVKSVAVES